MGSNCQIPSYSRLVTGYFIMSGKPDPYADIDFEEINEQTNLANDEIKCLKVCFDLFDTKKQDYLSADELGEIMRAMGFRPTEEELVDLVNEIDEDGSARLSSRSSASCAPPSLWRTPTLRP